MKFVKNVCPKCGTAIPYTKKEKFWMNVNAVWRTLLMAMGVLFIIYLSIVGVAKTMNNVTNAQFDWMSRGVADEMRLITMDVTKNCDGDNSYCYMTELYDNVSTIRYVPSSFYSMTGMKDPLYVYEHGGDCKNTANMYVAMLHSIGIKAEVDCNNKEHHCVAVVPWYMYGEYAGSSFVVDLTIPIMVQLQPGEKVWDYLKIAENDFSRVIKYGEW